MTKKHYAVIAGLLFLGICAGPQPLDAARTNAPFETRQSRGSLFEWSPLIQQVQQLLIEFDLFAGPAEGRLTPDTQQAIRAYQKQSDLTVDGEADEALLTHMETVGHAATLKQRLARARDEQIEKARNALEGNAATRDLLVRENTAIAALPTDESEACLRAPGIECLLRGATAAVATITRDDYRDWALRDLVRAQASAGRMDAARISIKRLSDLRLVLVSLREAATALAKSGHFAEARALAETLPDPWNKARALLAIAITGAAETHDALYALLPQLEDRDGAIEIAAELLANLAARGGTARTEKSITAIESLLDGDVSRLALGAVATAYARAGLADEAFRVLDRIGEKRRDHIALAEAAGMQARQRNLTQALATADKLRTPQLYVLAMTKIAAAQFAHDERDSAAAALRQAESAVLDIERAFAADTALARIATVWAKLADGESVLANVAKIKTATLKAQSLWEFSIKATPSPLCQHH